MPGQSKWSDEEADYVAYTQSVHSISHMSKVLNRSSSSVRNRIRRTEDVSSDSENFSEEKAFFFERAENLGKWKAKPRNKGKAKGGSRSWSGAGNPYRHTKSGFRSDIGINCRSNWEANVARILTLYSIDYEFEPKSFYFPVKRGTKGYIPDFYLTDTNEWIEVKGWFDDKSRIKIKRFKKYHSDEFAKLSLIISKYSKKAIAVAKDLDVPKVLFYENLSKDYKSRINTWEGN